MKNFLSLLFTFIILHTNATTHNVSVQNFQFSPSTINVSVGDVIHFVWVAGTHTTTSTSVPAGADAWDAPIDATHTTFDYTVAQPGSYSYQCTFHASFGMVATIAATGVVPVTLSAFNITTQNDRPLLTWTTETENNADYFSIRKSIDGTDFHEIGKVSATGNSSVQKSYSFSDDKISLGVTYVYYALAIVDKDGKTQLSPIKVYKNKNAVPKLIMFLSPNPVSGMGHLMFQFNADKPGIMIAKLLNTQGKLILKEELSAVRGINNGHIHLGNVPAGIYTIYFTIDNINECYKIVKN
ncbi:MAG TPA: plastocyanin/azurin family copper-binding protein [Ginsengibacter sp.]|nr:plastocyanin/azurin family copper-binding protein [Ginsengibacter sp.]